jgi:hypothetical protein
MGFRRAGRQRMGQPTASFTRGGHSVGWARQAPVGRMPHFVLSSLPPGPGLLVSCLWLLAGLVAGVGALPGSRRGCAGVPDGDTDREFSSEEPAARRRTRADLTGRGLLLPVLPPSPIFRLEAFRSVRLPLHYPPRRAPGRPAGRPNVGADGISSPVWLRPGAPHDHFASNLGRPFSGS